MLHVVREQLERGERRAQLVGGQNEELVASADRLARRLVEARILERRGKARRDGFGERQVFAAVVTARPDPNHRAEGRAGHRERDDQDGLDTQIAGVITQGRIEPVEHRRVTSGYTMDCPWATT